MEYISKKVAAYGQFVLVEIYFEYKNTPLQSTEEYHQYCYYYHYYYYFIKNHF